MKDPLTRYFTGNVEQKSQVITTSSIAGFNRYPTGGYAYGQSKAGATHLMKMLATQLVPYDIRFNVIAPGRKLGIFRSGYFAIIKTKL